MVKIRDIEVFVIDVPLERPFLMASRAIARQTEIIVKVHTDEGLVGVGSAHGSPLERVAEIVKHELGPLIVGEDALNIERLWQRMFETTCVPRARTADTTGASLPKGAGRPQVMAAIGGIDIALWDIAGQACGRPVWQLLGGCRTRIPTYGTGGYYHEDGSDDGLADEFAGYAEQGFRAVKLKAGRLTPEGDYERARIVRDAVGPDVGLYVDVSQGWDVWEAVRAGRLYERLDVAWYEEPIHWYDDVSGLAQVARHVRIPLTSGESEYTKQGVRDLILNGHIAITNFDCTKAGGLTEGRKIAALAEAHNVAFAPHHAAQIHAHLVGGVPNGLNVELHPDPARDPLWEQLFERKPVFDDGDLLLDETPGLGCVLDEAVMARVATEVR
jgi:L-alanine-DL-glutamate epimerase-like enolase superfamily enzyme